MSDEPDAASPAGEQPATKKASKGLPKGVTGPIRGGKYQARVTWKPAGITQRSLGTFATVDDAAAAVVAAEAQLKWRLSLG